MWGRNQLCECTVLPLGLIWRVNNWMFNTDVCYGLILRWENITMFGAVYRKSRNCRRGGRYEMYIVFLYLGFNLLNISKTADTDSSVCGSCFFFNTSIKDTVCTSCRYFPTSLKQLAEYMWRESSSWNFSLLLLAFYLSNLATSSQFNEESLPLYYKCETSPLVSRL